MLEHAARAGDTVALHLLAGSGGGDPDPTRPQSERYAWSQLLDRLDGEGCTGPAGYYAWATSPSRARAALLAMSPAEAATAQVRARAIEDEAFATIQQRLGCN